MMEGLAEMWPSTRTVINGVSMGDVWPHSKLSSDSISGGYVSFHKLSQWMTYSLMEPLMALGLSFPDMDLLTGLPEYRNGGLLLDTGVLEVVDTTLLEREVNPSEESIIEWRALTVSLLDVIYESWKVKYKVNSSTFPLVKLLEAGSWKAGRILAMEKRGGPPPIMIQSDGTVF